MPLPAIAFPAIDPVLVEFGPFAVRWYALAYIAGLLAGLVYIKALIRRPPVWLSAKDVDDFLIWAVVAVVLGGRLGYVLFYKPDYYLAHPGDILRTWEGGMSFHGGMLGVIAAAALFARARKIPFLHLGDMLACAAPIGLFLGRLANFINGELFGRAAPDVPWAVVFPDGGPIPRHPSQIYEAGLEGIVLFAVLFALVRLQRVRARPGVLGGVFLMGYGLSRFVVEYFREPDAFLGLFDAGGGVAFSMGQVLSLPMMLAGLILIRYALRQGPVPGGSKAKAGTKAGGDAR